jgi:hypothetical protein
MKKIFFVTLLFCSTFMACDPAKVETTSLCDQLQGDDYLVFGTDFGFCIGNCTHLYKLTTTELFEDDFDKFLNSKQPTFKTTPLNAAKVDIAKSVCMAFPNDLLKEKESRIGCPDCHDQGSIYVEIKKNGVVQSWFIDPDQNTSIAKAFQDYAVIVRDAVEKLEK